MNVSLCVCVVHILKLCLCYIIQRANVRKRIKGEDHSKLKLGRKWLQAGDLLADGLLWLPNSITIITITRAEPKDIVQYTHFGVCVCVFDRKLWASRVDYKNNIEAELC